MAVIEQTPVSQFTGNGVTTVFAFSFLVPLNTDLLVIVDGVTKTLGTDYTVAGTGVSSGGTVTFTTAPASGAAVSLVRSVPASRSTDYQENGDLLAEVLNDDFDRVVLMVQDAKAVLGARAVRAPVGELLDDLPASLDRANKFFYWDNFGQPTAADASSLASIVAYENSRVDTFDGDGVTVAFILAADPGVIENTRVAVDGLTLTPGIDYTLLAGVITCAVAPPAGTDSVVVFYGQALPSGVTDSDSVNWTAAGTGSAARDVQSKLRECAPISVVDKGGVVGSDCAASVTAAAASGSEVEFPAGAWTVTAAPTISASTVLRARPGATFSGAGAGGLGLYTGTSGVEQNIRLNTSGDDGPSFYFRRQANHAGGATGFVNNCVGVASYVPSGATAYEWAFLSVMDNSCTSADLTENVAVYGQGLKRSTGPTWAAVFEAIDKTSTANPTTGLVGCEFDIRANGTDSSGNRVAVDVVVTRQMVSGAYAGAAMQGGYGVRVQTGGDASATVLRAFDVSANCAVGFDTSQATVATAAYRMAAGQPIVFNAANTLKLYDDGGGLRMADASNAILARITTTGAFQGAGGVQVVGARDTGWSAMTGASDKATVYTVAGVTLAQLAGRVMALQAALTTHGLIGA